MNEVVAHDSNVDFAVGAFLTGNDGTVPESHAGENPYGEALAGLFGVE